MPHLRGSSPIRTMKIQRWIILLLLSLFVGVLAAACSAVSPAPTGTPIPTATETATPTLPPPPEKTTPVPDPEETVKTYLEAWRMDDYASMYNMLTTISQDAITEQDFTSLYTTVAA